MKTVHYIALILVIVGALNWGLVGLFAFDLVAALFGDMSVLSRIVYTLVGIAGIVIAATSAALTPTRHPEHHHRAEPAHV